MTKRITFEQFKKKALANKKVKQLYEELGPVYHLRKKMIAIRIASNMTQEEMAEAMHTQKSNISRLENVHSSASPTLSTIEAYAEAAGYKLVIDFVPKNTPHPHA